MNESLSARASSPIPRFSAVLALPAVREAATLRPSGVTVTAY